jgi:two-component system NtrC family sensor kinase
MKLKLITVLAAVALIFMGTVLWRTDRFVYGDRLSWVEAQSRTQTSAINHALAAELKSLQRVIGQIGLEGLQKNKNAWTSLNPYFAVATLNVTGSELDPQIFTARENSKAANWGREFVKSALGKLPNNARELRYFVKPFQDNQRGRFVAVVFLEGTKAFALFGSGESFQSLIDAQRGSLGNFSIVTTTGLTVSHSIPEYLGTVMKDDPLFQRAQKGAASQGGQVMKLASGEELYGLFEEVPRSNLWVMTTANLKEIMKGRNSLVWQFSLLAVGLLLVGIAGLLWVLIPADREKEELEESLALAQTSLRLQNAPPENKKVLAADPEVSHKDKLDASVRVASALAHEMRGPMTAIMGYSQMILAQTPTDEIVKNSESILRETRSARDVLDKLLGYAGENVQEKINMKIEGPLAKALKPLEPLFQQKGVKLVRNIAESTPLDLHVESLNKAFSNILQNAVEAMERMPKKELQINLFEDGEGTHLEFADTGEGIEPANLEKIFDPFFTTRSHRQQMGLGLSLAYGILKEHGATVRVESERSKGTRIHIIFAKQEAPAVLAAPKAKRKEEEVVVAIELPQLKKDSEHLVAAREEYQASQPAEKSPVSPLSVNIDQLLDFPEQGADDLQFLDGFMGNQKEIKEDRSENNQADRMDDRTVVIASAQSDIPQDILSADLDQPDEEFTNNIQPPKSAAVRKTTKLDSFHVEIRRPGKRI